MAFQHKHILGMAQMAKEDIEIILDTADAFKEVNAREIKKVPTLRHTIWPSASGARSSMPVTGPTSTRARLCST
ncbi:MAG: hypothetical protein P8Y91_12900 [Desulfuromonadales bacterium]